MFSNGRVVPVEAANQHQHSQPGFQRQPFRWPALLRWALPRPCRSAYPSRCRPPAPPRPPPPRQLPPTQLDADLFVSLPAPPRMPCRVTGRARRTRPRTALTSQPPLPVSLRTVSMSSKPQSKRPERRPGKGGYAGKGGVDGPNGTRVPPRAPRAPPLLFSSDRFSE